MEAPPKPSEEAVMPQTAKEKASNFWFHYKWHTLGTIAFVAVLTVLIVQLVTKPKYDYEVIYFSYTQVMNEQLDAVEEYFENIGTDLDGNGEVNIQVINCSCSSDNLNSTYKNSILTKLQAIIATDKEAMIFITDKDSYKYFDNASFKDSLFQEEPVLLSEDFYEKTTDSTFGPLVEGLQVSVRRLADTTLENGKDADMYHQEALRVLEELK